MPNDRIPVIRMSDNPDGDLNFYITKYNTSVRTTPKHMHEFMQINYIYKGRAMHVVNGQKCEVVKGDIFVIPPQVVHYIEPCDDDAEVVEFEFTPSFINQNFDDIKNAEAFLDFAYIAPFLVDESLVKPKFNLIGPIQTEVESILSEALKEYADRRPGFALMVRSLLLKLLVIVGREFTSYVDNSKSRPLYEKHRGLILGSLEYIEQNFDKDLSIELVAKEFTLSQSYFSFLFKSITSKTFTEYLNGIRIAKAQEMLKTSDKRVIDICFEAGFRNVNHFNRIFKQITGVSPVTYRKNK